MKEAWRYHFYFLSPEDYTYFFEKVREGKYAGWKSGLMQELIKSPNVTGYLSAFTAEPCIQFHFSPWLERMRAEVWTWR